MASTILPARPQLASFVQARMHTVDGNRVLSLLDLRDGEIYTLDGIAWDILSQCDGDHPLDALFRQFEHTHDWLRPLLEHLCENGLLTETHRSVALRPEVPPRDLHANERLLDTMDLRFECDANGVCCSVLSSIAFTDADRERALRTSPEVLAAHGGAHRVFLPVVSSAPMGVSAVALTNNQCVFLGGDALCTIHRVGGLNAKPHGCQLFPAVFIDDGEAVRVSMSLECGCAFNPTDSVKSPTLVDPAMLRRSDLPSHAHVALVPQTVRLDAQTIVSRRTVVALREQFLAAARSVPDIIHWLWSAASHLELDATPGGELLSVLEIANGIQPWVESLAMRTARRALQDASWRSAQDVSRVFIRWIAASLASCVDDASRVLAMLQAREEQTHRDELRAVQAWMHGYAFAMGESVVLTLRDLAVRLFTARVMRVTQMPATTHIARAGHPVSVVEAVLHAHGLGAYVRSVGRAQGVV